MLFLFKNSGLLWLQATNPTIFTPKAWNEGGLTRIIFRNPTGDALVSVYRTISRYPDGATGIQDEVHPLYENEGARFGYEIDTEGQLAKYPNNPAFTDTMQRCIGLIQPLVGLPGSTIIAEHRDYGEEARFVSDGTQWIDASTTGQQDGSKQVFPPVNKPPLES